MKKRIAFVVGLVLLLSFSACGGPAKDSSALKQTETPQASQWVSFTDSAGRTVEVPSDITRIAASGSLAQIVLFSIAPELLVGIASDWSDSAKQYIDAAYANLPVIGQFYGSDDLNLEQIAALDPQVIIDVGEAKDSIVEDMDSIMNQIGIPTIHIEASMDTMAEAYRMLGELLNKNSEAEELAQYCETTLDRTRELTDAVGQEDKVDLLYCLGSDGLNVIAGGSFHAEVIDLLSNNLAVLEDPSPKGTGNPLDMEQLLNWDPEVIVFAPDSIYETVGSDSTWQQLRAIREGSFYEVPQGPYNWMGVPPSVNRYLGMLWLSQLLYPDTAGYDLYEETVRFYQLFYHCSLTEAQYNALVENSLG
jgi:iron complex transport system substrate-binding protein